VQRQPEMAHILPVYQSAFHHKPAKETLQSAHSQ
jgi:hypothetical protein